VSVIIAVLAGKFSPLTYFVPQNVVETQLKPTAGHALTTDINSFLQGAGVIPFMATAVIVAVTYVALTLVLGRISGAHLNPAITIARLTQRTTRLVEGVLYIVAQMLGALLAMSLMTSIGAINPDTLVLHLADWNMVYAELLGSFIFAFGVASAALYRRSVLTQAGIVGGSYLVGAVIATVGGAKGLLNPAIAFGTNAIATLNGQQRLMLYLTYVIAPILGAIIGFALFRLISRELREDTMSKI
jgi:glycerol uptake facilitator-like aquaporin